MTSLKTSIKTITYLSDIGCLEIQGASLAMNPISRIGYTFMLKRNHALVERAGEVKKSIDSMSGE